MLKELIEYGNNIKKIQEEMKFTLNEIKKNLQGTKSGGNEAGIQINNLEHKEEVSIQPEQWEEKKKFKKWGEYQDQMHKHPNYRDARRRRGRARNWKIIWKNIE